MSEDYFDDVIDDDSRLTNRKTDVESDNIEVDTRSVVLAKEGMIALLGLKTSSQGGLIVRVDPRQEKPAAQVYDKAETATFWFRRSLRSSRKNGWIVVYDGIPAFG